MKIIKDNRNRERCFTLNNKILHLISGSNNYLVIIRF